MGLFDRIRGSDEEVEIRPQQRDDYDYRDTEGEADAGGTAAEDDTGGEFVLPGMKSAADTSDDTADDSRTRSRESRQDRGRDRAAGIDRIVEQNERIIELLEEIAGEDDDSDTAAVL
ncbi:MAG: hypothetical protein SVU88_04840 [Candidatus Nanohaloarchaea archaeon]|nr:hypothetical protein [Candidatus Nanohaloarchaea archaeon]